MTVITDDPCDDWANNIERRWTPMMDPRTRHTRRAFRDTLDPSPWTLDRSMAFMSPLRCAPPKPINRDDIINNAVVITRKDEE
jgi:hypothetical protein